MHGYEGYALTSTKNLDLIPASNSDLSKKRKEVEGNTKRVLSHNARRVRASRVEVAEKSAVPAGVGLTVVLDNCGTASHISM